MSISFKSVGHAFAVFFKAVGTDLAKVEASKTIVETATGSILSAVDPALAGTALGIEDAAYAVLGEVSSLIVSGGAAGEAALLNAGLDQSVVQAVKNVAGSAQQVAVLVKAAVISGGAPNPSKR